MENLKIELFDAARGWILLSDSQARDYLKECASYNQASLGEVLERLRRGCVWYSNGINFKIRAPRLRGVLDGESIINDFLNIFSSLPIKKIYELWDETNKKIYGDEWREVAMVRHSLTRELQQRLPPAEFEAWLDS